MIHQESFTDTGHRIAHIAKSTEAAVSIGLLDAVDGTVSVLDAIAKIMSGFHALLAGATDEIAKAEIIAGQYIDEDDVAIDAIERTSAMLKDFLIKLVNKRAAINIDARLRDHHCEALHDSYELAMNATASMAESIQMLRSAIISHDLAAEPRSNAEVFITVDELIASLRGQ